ncbi:hypothetical protein ARMGADRAFT_1028448 [Armillaria gallica]|uniref:Uncharacterized protein n=1 Tax=Armillaria gallica TaxID=47427 RepID=A0A2H3DW02_ARMGA|nr:hypothetical protein ARMGADRAFT_1028448 [Armillaria gallica]
MHAGNTTSRNPFWRGTYGLRQTHGATGRMLAQTQTPTTWLSPDGSERPLNPSDTYRGDTHPFHDLHPNFELPDAPVERDPVPSYETRDSQELPRGPVPGFGNWPDKTHIHSNQTMTPSTPGDQTTSGPSFRKSTEKSSAPIKVQHGNSDDETSSSDSSGPTLGIRKSVWTSTWLLKVATQLWENTLTPTWPHSYIRQQNPEPIPAQCWAEDSPRTTLNC